MSSAAHHDVTQPDWFKSSYSSSTGSCVETLVDTGEVGIRDSKHPSADMAKPSLAVATPQWAAFLRQVRT